MVTTFFSVYFIKNILLIWRRQQCETMKNVDLHASRTDIKLEGICIVRLHATIRHCKHYNVCGLKFISQLCLYQLFATKICITAVREFNYKICQNIFQQFNYLSFYSIFSIKYSNCLFVWGLQSHSRSFHSYGDIIITDEEL